MLDLATLTTTSIATILINGIGLFWLKERMRQSINHEYSVKLEAVKKEVQSELQQGQQLFNLGAMSHMAITVFNKHVEFSELYLEKVLHAFNYLRSNSDDVKLALTFAGELTMIRFKYAAWLTEGIDKQLKTFEDKLRTLGANGEYISMPKGEGTDQEDRDRAAREMLSILSAFISWNQPPENHPEVHLNSIHNTLRDILGVSKLVNVRELIIQNANLQSVPNTDKQK